MGISICIPTYNRLLYLKRLLDSIFSGFKDYPYEIIVADGGSTDGTIEHLKSLNNVILIEQKELKGSVRAYNDCFKLAKYEYVFWPADDFILRPEVLIKSCQLMDKYQEIAIVAPKVQEPTYGNLPGVELFATGLVLSKTHIFRRAVLKEINYFDENFRTYAVDDDSCLSVLNLGYAIIFTKEVGIIHTRLKDKLRTLNINTKKNEYKQERKYFKKKWMHLIFKINKYIDKFYFKKYNLNFFQFFCRTIFKLGLPRFLAEGNHKFIINLYDRFLERSVFFKAKEYDHLKDFYLAQKLPKEILD